MQPFSFFISHGDVILDTLKNVHQHTQKELDHCDIFSVIYKRFLKLYDLCTKIPNELGTLFLKDFEFC